MQLCVQVMINWRYAHSAGREFGGQKALGFVILLCLVSLAAAQTDFQEVEPRQLIANPKNYWSLGIVFEDRLMDAQAGRRTIIGSKEYIPFRTLKVGTCYAEARLAPELSTAKLDRDYLFRGTVLNRPPSFFSRQEKFFVVIQSFAPALAETAVTSTDLFPGDTTGKQAAGTAESQRLLSAVQQSLFAYAEQKNLTISDLFSESAYRPQVMELINSAIVREQNEQNTTALGLLGELIYSVYARNYAPQAATRESAGTKSPGISLKAGVGGRAGSVTPAPNKDEGREPPEKPSKPKLKLRDGMNNVQQPVGW